MMKNALRKWSTLIQMSAMIHSTCPMLEPFASVVPQMGSHWRTEDRGGVEVENDATLAYCYYYICCICIYICICQWHTHKEKKVGFDTISILVRLRLGHRSPVIAH